jgi:hypothetical protein
VATESAPIRSTGTGQMPTGGMRTGPTSLDEARAGVITIGATTTGHG